MLSDHQTLLCCMIIKCHFYMLFILAVLVYTHTYHELLIQFFFLNVQNILRVQMPDNILL